MPLVLDIHALQSLPPSNINRDDTGAPKSAVFGGVPRHRVSSQSWKRAIRQDFERVLGADQVGFRTKHVAELIAKRMRELAQAAGAEWSAQKATDAVTGLFDAAKISLSKPVLGDGDDARPGETGYLLFLSSRQIENAARFLLVNDGVRPSKQDAKALLDDQHSIDIAMFGRMVADAPDFNVDAAVQVAHAIGIHESEPEFDYYTAVDDVVEDREESGAGMIGTMQMTSSTLYRFATVDMTSLAENLGTTDAAVEAAAAFVTSFISSLPTGKQNSYAHNTVPELVYIAVRDSRSLSLVNAFEDPVRTGDGASRRLEGARRLAQEAEQLQTQYGFVPRESFVIGLGNLPEPFEGIATRTTLPELDGRIHGALSAEETV